MSKRAEEPDRDTPPPATHNIAGEIWGVVFMALGVLVFISLCSHFLQRGEQLGENLLGPIVGTALARGLVFIFGAIPALAFPLTAVTLGWLKLRGKQARSSLLAYGGLMTIEVCTLLAIRAQPIDNFSPNMVGSIVAYALQHIFGHHRFGPYFVTSLGLVITVLLAFRITVTHAALWIAALIRRPAAAAQGAPRNAALPDVKPPKRQSPRRENGDDKETAPAAAGAPKLKLVKKDAPEPDPAADEELDPEEEAQKRLEAELAQFRAKKNEPIKITTVESTEEAEADEAGEGEEEPGEIDEGDRVEIVADDVPADYYKIAEHVPEKPKKVYKPYVLPSPDVIPEPPPFSSFIDRDAIERNSHILEKTLMNFGLEGKVVNVSPGPVVTRYEIELAPGIKVSRVVSLQDDISMAVGGQKIRIQAPIPGKAAIGIELPNENRQTVYFKHILMSEAFQKAKAKLPMVVGRNISGAPFVTDIAKMPHLLIAGQTGSGKSVCINSFICSLLMTKTPEELRLIMIDPKKVELSYYQGIPHLLAPVVTESKEAVKALQWGQLEMDRRYRMFAKAGARNIDSFNERLAAGKIREGLLSESDNKPLPFIVIIVDELADLMITASKDVEASIQRVAQLARAVGIHLIVATQRPSVDIITGPIKANLTSRIAFRTIQSTDSRTILGHIGSEKLLGQGDMLFLRSGAPDIERFHGSFISEEDVELIVGEIRKQSVDIEKIDSFMDAGGEEGADDGMPRADGDRDEFFEEAAQIIVSIGQGSTSLLQRRMKIGYARAGRLMDELERAGIVGPSEGSKVREVLVKPMELEELLQRLR